MHTCSYAWLGQIAAFMLEAVYVKVYYCLFNNYVHSSI